MIIVQGDKYYARGFVQELVFPNSSFAFQQNVHNPKLECMSPEALYSEDMITSGMPGKKNCPFGKPAASAC